MHNPPQSAVSDNEKTVEN